MLFGRQKKRIKELIAVLDDNQLLYWIGIMAVGYGLMVLSTEVVMVGGVSIALGVALKPKGKG